MVESVYFFGLNIIRAPYSWCFSHSQWLSSHSSAFELYFLSVSLVVAFVFFGFLLVFNTQFVCFFNLFT